MRIIAKINKMDKFALVDLFIIIGFQYLFIIKSGYNGGQRCPHSLLISPNTIAKAQRFHWFGFKRKINIIYKAKEV